MNEELKELLTMLERCKENFDSSSADTIEDLSAMLETEPNSQILKRRGDVYYDNADYNKAIADYTAALEKDESGGQNKNWLRRVYMKRGRAYFFKKEYDKAIADFNVALEIKPDYYKALIWRNHAIFTLGS